MRLNHKHREYISEVLRRVLTGFFSRMTMQYYCCPPETFRVHEKGSRT